MLPMKVAFTLPGVFGSTPIRSMNYKFSKVLRLCRVNQYQGMQRSLEGLLSMGKNSQAPFSFCRGGVGVLG